MTFIDFYKYEAAVVCPLTCKTCGSVPTSSPTISHSPTKYSSCFDDDSKKFFKETKTSSSGSVIVVTKSCLWLRAKNEPNREEFCNLAGAHGVPSAKDVCLKTCDNC